PDAVLHKIPGPDSNTSGNSGQNDNYHSYQMRNPGTGEERQLRGSGSRYPAEQKLWMCLSKRTSIRAGCDRYIFYFLPSYNFVPVQPAKILFPFDGCRWFTADIVYHPVDSFYLFDDIVRNLSQKIIGKMRPVCRHAIHRGNGTECNRKFIRTFVAHHTYTFYREQNRAGLPDTIV